MEQKVLVKIVVSSAIVPFLKFICKYPYIDLMLPKKFKLQENSYIEILPFNLDPLYDSNLEYEQAEFEEMQFYIDNSEDILKLKNIVI